ncbi:MAG: polyprenyl synthetase family protein, partial [Bacteroidales bacterium]|nr:polyprenyl synthetase family protein [Bacteroidales bacterium]
DEYMNMIGLKTGVLIACAAKMGALIGGASKEECECLYDYGFNLGLAFQVADDYLDAFGDEKVFGKPIGGDIVNSKKSWLTVRAFEKAEGGALADLEEAMTMPVGTVEEKDAKIRKVKGLYQELGVGKDAQVAILRLNSKALESASKVCDKARFDVLRYFAEKLIGRTR